MDWHNKRSVFLSLIGKAALLPGLILLTTCAPPDREPETVFPGTAAGEIYR